MVLIVMGAMALLFSGLERMPQIRFRPSSLFRRYFASDIIYLVTGFIAGGSAALNYFISTSGWLGQGLNLPRLSSVILPMWLLVPLAIVAIDIGNYVAHYWLHRSDALWEFHKVHHSIPMLDWLATFRSHIIEQVFRRLLAPMLLILIGFPLEAVLIANAIFIGWAMLNHSNLDINVRFLESVFITPRLHRLHHVNQTSEKNLGTVFTFWDRMRGTFIRADLDVKTVFSNGDVNYPQGWLPQLVEPLRQLAQLHKVSYQQKQQRMNER
jgi:sterol desaturase/sphingolipid hydroxylase (fatty acid hydroxylase superfamily)